MLKLYSKLSAFSFGLLVCLVMYALLEVFFGYLSVRKSAQRDQPILEYSHDRYYESDPQLGYRPFANTSIQSSLKKRERKRYDVTYEIDQYHRRITPVTDMAQRDQYALFFGGSYAFGEGVEDDETLPSHFARLSKEYVPYNYAFHGYGPQSMLAKLQQENMRSQVSEDKGICLYVYLPYYHEQRAIGSMQVVTGWGKNLPWYTLNKEDKIVRMGDFENGRPLLWELYSLFSKSNIVSHFKLDFPLRIRDKHYYVTARILNEARKEFKKKFQSDHFYVLIYPHDFREVKIVKYLDEMKVEHLSYDLFSPFQEGYYIEGDCHPNSKALETIAQALAQDLQGVNG